MICNILIFQVMTWSRKDEDDGSNSDSDYELASESINHDHIDQVISDTIGLEPIRKQNSDEILLPTDCHEDTEDKEHVMEEKEYSEVELISIREKALDLKNEGNNLYKSEDYQGAKDVYSRAILLCRKQLNDLRSILHANRAACHFSEAEYQKTEDDCSIAIELNPKYLKAILRRAQVREKLDKLSPALEDYKTVLELDHHQRIAVEAAQRLPKQIEIQQEKMKEECISKLKDLGNLVLKPFGLSTDNFNMVQDPNFGGYNIQFSQNK